MHRNFTSTNLTLTRSLPVESAREYWANDSYRAHKMAAATFALGTGDQRALGHARALQTHPGSRFGFFPAGGDR